MKNIRVVMDSTSNILLSPETWTVITPGFARKRDASIPARVNATKSSGAKKRRAPVGLAPSKARKAWSEKHSHRTGAWEILLALRGNDWLGLDGVLYPCRPGFLFLIDPHVPHDYRYPKIASELEHIWVTSHGEYLMAFWLRIMKGRRTLLHKHLTVLPLANAGVAPLGFPARNEPISSPRNRIRMRLMMGLVTTYMESRLREDGSRAAVTGFADLQRDVVDSVCRLINETAGNGISLRSLESFGGYSKYHLARLFRQRTGCTIHQYIDMARLRRMRTLKEKGLSNGAVAQELGFSDASTFLRWRRQRHAKVPKPLDTAVLSRANRQA